MKSTILIALLGCSAFAQTTPGTAGQTAPGNKMDDQPSRTAVPKTNRNKKRTDATTVPPAKTATTPTDPSMPNDPKTPITPTAPRTPVKPTDPTQPTVNPHLI